MPRGGARPNAGRRKGSGNKMSAKAREAAAATGMLPHEFLLTVMRGGKPAKTLLGVAPTKEERIDAAKGAAPYYAPRLSAVGVKAAGPDNPWPELLEMVNGSGRTPPGTAAEGG